MEKTETWVHHAEPFVVSGEIFREFADGFSEPFLDGWVVDTVAIHPILVAGIIGWINENTFDFTDVIR